MKLKNCRHIKLKSNDDGLKIPISDFAKAKFELYNSVYYLLKQFKQNCKSEDNIELINRVFDSFYKSDVCFFLITYIILILHLVVIHCFLLIALDILAQKNFSITHQWRLLLL